MKKLNTVPSEVIDAIKSEHEKALDKIFQEDICFCELPIRVVKMKVHRSSKAEDTLEQVIVPKTLIHIKKDAFLDENTLNRDAIRYSVANTYRPFPFGHIYKETGSICLGNIFVPSRISKYTPQQPLDTLFLHNDRNVSHGNAHLQLSNEMLTIIYDILESNQIYMSDDTKDVLHPNHNIIRNDGLWLLSADIFQNAKNLRLAIAIMEKIYDQIFVTTNKS